MGMPQRKLGQVSFSELGDDTYPLYYNMGAKEFTYIERVRWSRSNAAGGSDLDFCYSGFGIDYTPFVSAGDMPGFDKLETEVAKFASGGVWSEYPMSEALKTMRLLRPNSYGVSGGNRISELPDTEQVASDDDMGCMSYFDLY